MHETVSSAGVPNSFVLAHENKSYPSCIASMSESVHNHAEIVECHNAIALNNENRVAEGVERCAEKKGIDNFLDCERKCFCLIIFVVKKKKNISLRGRDEAIKSKRNLNG